MTKRETVAALAREFEIMFGQERLETVIEEFTMFGDRPILDNVPEDKLPALEAALRI